MRTIWYFGRFSTTESFAKRPPSKPTLNFNPPDAHSSPGRLPPHSGSGTKSSLGGDSPLPFSFVSKVVDSLSLDGRGFASRSRPRLRAGGASLARPVSDSMSDSAYSRSRLYPAIGRAGEGGSLLATFSSGLPFSFGRLAPFSLRPTRLLRAK